MKTMLLLGCLLFAAIMLASLAGVKPSTLRKWGRDIKRQAGIACMVQINGLGDGTHAGGAITKKADAAHTYRHLLVKVGSDADHVAINTDGDCPSGICTDTPEAAEDAVAVQRLGSAKGTVLMVASEAITAESEVFTADDGKVQNLPTTAGSYYLVGRAVTAAGAANQEFEVEPCFPLRTVIVAAAADIAALKTAVASPALIHALAS